jgi:hypothetical protein
MGDQRLRPRLAGFTQTARITVTGDDLPSKNSSGRAVPPRIGFQISICGSGGRQVSGLVTGVQLREDTIGWRVLIQLGLAVGLRMRVQTTSIGKEI